MSRRAPELGWRIRPGLASDQYSPWMFRGNHVEHETLCDEFYNFSVLLSKLVESKDQPMKGPCNGIAAERLFAL
jgi:hypothetical protein